MKTKIWQDWVLMSGGYLFALALVPIMLDSSCKVSIYSSAMNATVLAVFAYTQWTLNLKKASIANIITTLQWLFISLFRH